MSSQCSGALPTELRWMAAPRGANATRVEAGSEPASPSLGIRFLAALFAGLVGLYHAEHCLAEVITGSTDDGVVSVSWEYDLEQATGQVTIENLVLPLNTTGELLYLAGLIPDGATSILYDPAVVSIDPCAVMGAGPPPLPHVFADLPPGAQTVITFETCTPTDQGGPLRSEPACGPAIAAVEYGNGFVYANGSHSRFCLIA